MLSLAVPLTPITQYFTLLVFPTTPQLLLHASSLSLQLICRGLLVSLLEKTATSESRLLALANQSPTDLYPLLSIHSSEHLFSSNP